jgi:lipoate-protein ligase A
MPGRLGLAACFEIRSGAADGARNMALDGLLLDMAGRGDLSFALRSYTWSPACVSLGRLQDPRREISAADLREAGVGAVRRPTGGRAVWHETELTYCIASRPDHPLVSGCIEESLAKTGRVLAEALRTLGIPAELAPADRHSLSPRAPANPCFTSHGRMEVMVAGRKVVGSAQARRRGAFLEHGSIIMRNDQVRLADFLPGSDEQQRAGIRRILEEGACGLCEISPGITLEAIRDSLHESFRRALGGELRTWTEDDLPCGELAELDAACRREADSWN